MPRRRPANHGMDISFFGNPRSDGSKLAPKRRNALRFAPVRAELLFGIKILPSTAALEFANMGKPPLCQRMPFLGDTIEANPALHSSH